MTITSNDPLQPGYCYKLTAAVGQLDFKPQLTPRQMLELGVFGGNYFEGETEEYPASWFKNAKLSNYGHDSHLNYFDIDASQTRQQWQANGWISPEDPRGWFQWYCRYFMGRRLPKEDTRQINRWRQMSRHLGQVQANCVPGDQLCRRRQRQALLHWAYDSRNI
jgi:hypothetical protein